MLSKRVKRDYAQFKLATKYQTQKASYKRSDTLFGK